MTARAVTEAELGETAGALAHRLAAGAIVWLEGDLGAGKTTFARAFAAARGATEPVTSPTFALVHRYEGPRGTLHHVDCFRLRSPDDAADLDWETLAAGDALLIEWPERAGSWAPAPDVRIRLAHLDDEDRREVRLDAPRAGG